MNISGAAGSKVNGVASLEAVAHNHGSVVFSFVSLQLFLVENQLLCTVQGREL